LAAAAALLRPKGEVLVFWDCYRPHDVQVRMFEAVPDPNWVARPGPDSRSHAAGRSGDATLANAGRPAGHSPGRSGTPAVPSTWAPTSTTSLRGYSPSRPTVSARVPRPTVRDCA